MIPTVSANGSPAFGQYKPSEHGPGYDPWALQVLEIADGRVAEFTFSLATWRWRSGERRSAQTLAVSRARPRAARTVSVNVEMS